MNRIYKRMVNSSSSKAAYLVAIVAIVLMFSVSLSPSSTLVGMADSPGADTFWSNAYYKTMVEKVTSQIDEGKSYDEIKVKVEFLKEKLETKEQRNALLKQGGLFDKMITNYPNKAAEITSIMTSIPHPDSLIKIGTAGTSDGTDIDQVLEQEQERIGEEALRPTVELAGNTYYVKDSKWYSENNVEVTDNEMIYKLTKEAHTTGHLELADLPEPAILIDYSGERYELKNRLWYMKAEPTDKLVENIKENSAIIKNLNNAANVKYSGLGLNSQLPAPEGAGSSVGGTSACTAFQQRVDYYETLFKAYEDTNALTAEEIPDRKQLEDPIAELLWSNDAELAYECLVYEANKDGINSAGDNLNEFKGEQTPNMKMVNDFLTGRTYKMPNGVSLGLLVPEKDWLRIGAAGSAEFVIAAPQKSKYFATKENYCYESMWKGLGLFGRGTNGKEIIGNLYHIKGDPIVLEKYDSPGTPSRKCKDYLARYGISNDQLTQNTEFSNKIGKVELIYVNEDKLTVHSQGFNGPPLARLISTTAEGEEVIPNPDLISVGTNEDSGQVYNVIRGDQTIYLNVPIQFITQTFEASAGAYKKEDVALDERIHEQTVQITYVTPSAEDAESSELETVRMQTSGEGDYFIHDLDIGAIIKDKIDNGEWEIALKDEKTGEAIMAPKTDRAQVVKSGSVTSTFSKSSVGVISNVKPIRIHIVNEDYDINKHEKDYLTKLGIDITNLPYGFQKVMVPADATPETLKLTVQQLIDKFQAETDKAKIDQWVIMYPKDAKGYMYFSQKRKKDADPVSDKPIQEGAYMMVTGYPPEGWSGEETSKTCKIAAWNTDDTLGKVANYFKDKDAEMREKAKYIGGASGECEGQLTIELSVKAKPEDDKLFYTVDAIAGFNSEWKKIDQTHLSSRKLLFDKSQMIETAGEGEYDPDFVLAETEVETISIQNEDGETIEITPPGDYASMSWDELFALFPPGLQPKTSGETETS